MKASQENQKFAQIIQRVAPQSKLLRTWQLKGGISAEMTALEMETPDGQRRRMIVRRHNQGQQTAEKEFRLLQIMHSVGLATQTPYHLDQSGQIFATPYLVIDYTEGRMEFSPANLDNHMLQLAAQLAKIHSVDCANLDLAFLPKNVDGCAEMGRKRPLAVDRALDEGHIRDTLASAWPLQRGNASALLHGDFWPGNTLWQDGQLAAVIDWEDAELGDPLTDLAKSRSEIGWIFGIKAMNAFTQHYQSRMAIDYAHLPYWDLCAALRLVRLANSNFAELAAFFPPFGRPDITKQTIRENYQLFIAQAFEKLAVQ